MVGLSVLLESQENTSKKASQVISKGKMIKPLNSSPTTPSPCGFSRRNTLPNSGFLDHCFLCKQKLLPGKDIYMYKGDRAFCSVECRCRQIFMDEEETVKKSRRDNCSMAAIKPRVPSSASSSSSSSTTNRSGKAPRNGANAFAY
ncbi:Hypothetical predicted protein [Olea europaea subsp. europaea]|uniref:FLZ-type domain-containing protein n=2 Tax=Olea europaea subsp. europaea TaxID=158383 RepID=A0A8S0SX77_OLEEU|nr:Hypothetical predicted protein [Olea europaea subsp. europaea]